MSRKNGRTENATDVLRVGALVEVTIERIVPGGLGLAHAAGRTFFVALAAPGDLLRVRVERVQGRIVFASIQEILNPSPARTAPPCPYFGRCGGCDFQQLTYEAQLNAKREIIRDALRRIGRLELPMDLRIVPAPAALHYRARAQWQYDQKAKTLGYYERGTHRICDVLECPVLVPELQQTLSAARAQMSGDQLPESTGEIQAVAGDDGVSLSPAFEDEATHEVTRTIRGERYQFSAGGFFQINQQLLPALVEEAVGKLSGSLALDLYCGVGLFTLPLARSFSRVIGLEGNSRAVSFAQSNLTRAGLENAGVIAATVGIWLERNAASLPPVDLIVLDPPRSGAEPETIQSIKQIAPNHISYVSCDPTTLARDLRMLVADDKYIIGSVVGLDLFPQTHHVETVVHLKHSRLVAANLEDQTLPAAA